MEITLRDLLGAVGGLGGLVAGSCVSFVRTMKAKQENHAERLIQLETDSKHVAAQLASIAETMKEQHAQLSRDVRDAQRDLAAHFDAKVDAVARESRESVERVAREGREAVAEVFRVMRDERRRPLLHAGADTPGDG